MKRAHKEKQPKTNTPHPHSLRQEYSDSLCDTCRHLLNFWWDVFILSLGELKGKLCTPSSPSLLTCLPCCLVPEGRIGLMRCSLKWFKCLASLHFEGRPNVALHVILLKGNTKPSVNATPHIFHKWQFSASGFHNCLNYIWGRGWYYSFLGRRNLWRLFYFSCVPRANFLGWSCKGELDLTAYKVNEIFSHLFAWNTYTFKIIFK